MVRFGLVAWLAFGTPAFAARPTAAPEGGLVFLESRVLTTLQDAEDMQAANQPGRGIISPKAGVARFEEALYHLMVEDYQPAAEGFFILVTTGALVEADLQLDAEWYLAEALLGMGNAATAETWFHQIADDSKNPFRDDAVRRLLELYSSSGRLEEFRAYYDAMIASGKVAPSDPVTYSLAKSFYHQKDYLRAKSALSDLGVASPYYRKARYWLGTIAVVEGNLDEALAYFDEVAAQSVTSPDDRDIYDLALLAGARISLERRQYDEAAARYAKIGGDSKYLADKLYEETWTFITHKEEIRKKLRDDDTISKEERAALEAEETSLRQAAQRGVDIFLLAFPEHPYTPQLKLLAGQLKQHAQDWDGALQDFEQVIAEYRPVRERFELLAADSAAASRYLDPLLAYEKTGYFETDLPPYALALLIQDKDIKTAAQMKGTLEQQRKNITASEQIIEDLTKALDAPGGIAIHRRRIAEVEAVSDTTLFLQLDLLAEEQRMLTGTAKKADLDALTKRRFALQSQIFEGQRGEAVDSEMRTLVADQARLRTADPSLKAEFAKIGGWHDDLARQRTVLADVRSTLKETEAAEAEKVKARIGEEAVEVDAQRTALAITGDRADEVMTAMTRDGFARLAEVFGEAAMTADMGIVDVYWATLLDTAEERTNLADDRQERLDLLERDFERIRQQLGPVK